MRQLPDFSLAELSIYYDPALVLSNVTYGNVFSSMMTAELMKPYRNPEIFVWAEICAAPFLMPGICSDAFPDGIPIEIIRSGEHFLPVDGDNGIVFEEKESVGTELYIDHVN